MKRPAEPISKVDLAMAAPERGELFGGPEAAIAVLTVERERLSGERLFREVAVANLEAMHAAARAELDRVFPAMSFVDAPQAALFQNDQLARLFMVASSSWRQEQIERIAGEPRPGHSVQWSVLTQEETAARIVEIGERLTVLEREREIIDARKAAAKALARAEALERGEILQVAGDIGVPEREVEIVHAGREVSAASTPTETTVDEDDLGSKGPEA